VSGYPGFQGNAGGCSDRRMPQSAAQDQPVKSSVPAVFASPVTGERFDNVKRSWEALRERAGLSNFWFHDLRHTFASKLVMAGQDLYVIKELLGHSTIQMTERYAHLAPDLKANAVEFLA